MSVAPVVRELSEHDHDRWDAFVYACPEATFFHRAGWQTVIQRAFGHRTCFLYAEANGVIQGVLPLAEIKSSLFGHSDDHGPYSNSQIDINGSQGRR